MLNLELSEIARQFIAGIIKHARAFTAITNPTVNSYKRLVPGYEAPCYVAWSASNRSPINSYSGFSWFKYTC